MAPNYASLHQKLIQAITAAAPKGTNPARREFIAAFYASSTVADLKELEAKHAATIALTAEEFFAQRVAGTPKISISETIVVEQGRSYTRTRIMLINDDTPFLVDSISALCTALGFTIHLILHPVLAANRDAKGARKSGAGSTHESLIYLELSPMPSSVTPKSLEAELRHALSHVSAAVADWRAMRDHTRSLTDHYTEAQPGISASEALEIRDLLIWLAENHFVFLGLADYRTKGDALVLDEKTARGIYRIKTAHHPIERATVSTSVVNPRRVQSWNQSGRTG
jgi:glutamate dehydrogenase